jgi:hypothetical protein
MVEEPNRVSTRRVYGAGGSNAQKRTKAESVPGGKSGKRKAESGKRKLRRLVLPRVPFLRDTEIVGSEDQSNVESSQEEAQATNLLKGFL